MLSRAPKRKALTRGPQHGHLDRAEPLVNPVRSGSGFVALRTRKEWLMV